MNVKKPSTILGFFLMLTLFVAPIAFAADGDAAPAAEAAKIDTGDTAFVLISAALVMMMTPALALFYGGMSRSKNVLSVIMQSFICLGVISLQ